MISAPPPIKDLDHMLGGGNSYVNTNKSSQSKSFVNNTRGNTAGRMEEMSAEEFDF
jgi:hypothetical protein